MTDVPKSMGGKDKAPQPVETLLAALIGCTQATALYVGRQISPRIKIQRMEFDLKGHRDNRGAIQLPIEEKTDVPPRLQLITGTVVVFGREGALISEEQLHALKELTEARCPVANMILASGCEMDVDWIDGS
eukprot:CAMPEP_0167750162 /NCGR_PEP_ID=MMETSP0110_2-20121227/5832_1 /TAXON_ID=629695 /ORGANISM="Gymnochlora sp., Strain CCMP2014" /LENGTH=131 /DNA_ID=CAMNT_0007635441 /DNA_START=280 /DNA_END=671 /DNA_ORIENTATION=+